jgi:hypothetical protein
MSFRTQDFRKHNQKYAPVYANINGVPTTISGYQRVSYEQLAGFTPDTMGRHATINQHAPHPHAHLVSNTVRSGGNYQLPGPNFRSGQTVQTVFGVSFLCTTPRKGTRAPKNISNAKHIVAEDASACQLECLEVGKNKCNVYSYKPSTFAANCTIGYMASLATALEPTDDQESVAGLCVSLTDAASNIFYPPVH